MATVVLSIHPLLLYLLGDPQDPVVVWKKLAGQFEKKTWVARLDLRRKLHSLRLKDGESAQEHIRVLIELFDALSVAVETVSEDDRVVYLLASLPDRCVGSEKEERGKGEVCNFMYTSGFMDFYVVVFLFTSQLISILYVVDVVSAESKSQSATIPTATPSSTDATSQEPGE